MPTAFMQQGQVFLIHWMLKAMSMLNAAGLRLLLLMDSALSSKNNLGLAVNLLSGKCHQQNDATDSVSYKFPQPVRCEQLYMLLFNCSNAADLK